MKNLLLFLFFLMFFRVNAQEPDMAVREYIYTYKQIAIEEMKRTGVPAAIKLAQGIHETGAGKGDLVLRSNNHFGIKCKNTWTGGKVYHDDDARGECFRSYASAIDSYRDHSDFLKNNSRYHFLFKLNPEDYKGWAYGLKKAGYATNNKYSQLLIHLIEKYDLQKYSLIAMGKRVDDDPVFVKDNSISPVTVQAISRAEQKAYSSTIPIDYPEGIFELNNTRVIFSKAGTSLFALANTYNISYSRLLEYNDFEQEEEILTEDQLIYLQKKKKTGNSRFYKVIPGQDLHRISQLTGIRLSSLLEYNHLDRNSIPAAGELLYLQSKAPNPPKIQKEYEVLYTSVNNLQPVNQPSGAGLYKIQKGDTLFSISKRLGISVEDIKKLNGLSGNTIHEGQYLKIQN